MAKQLSELIGTNYTISYSPQVLLQDPRKGALVATVIATWAETQQVWAEIFEDLMGSDKKSAALAVLASIKSEAAAREAVQEAAKHTLSLADFDLYCAVMQCVQQSREVRNKFAHHQWGVCKELRGVLVLRDPGKAQADSLALKRSIRVRDEHQVKEWIRQSVFDRGDLVFDEGDLRRELINATKARELMTALHLALKGSFFDEVKMNLRANPHIASEIARIEKKREDRRRQEQAAKAKQRKVTPKESPEPRATGSTQAQGSPD